MRNPEGVRVTNITPALETFRFTPATRELNLSIANNFELRPTFMG